MAPQIQVLATPPVLAMSSSAPSPSTYLPTSSAVARNPSYPSYPSSSGAQPASDASANATTPPPSLSFFSPTKPPATTATAPNPTPATTLSPTGNLTPPITTATSAPRAIPISSSRIVHAGISDLNRSVLAATIGLIIPPTELSSSPSYSISPSSYSSSLPTPIDSLRRHPTDLTTPIPEECDEETCSESLPNDPVTPVSGRQSRDFRFRDSHEFYHRDSVPNSVLGAPLGIPEHSGVPLSQTSKQHLQPTSQATPQTLVTEDLATPVKKVVTQPEHNLSAPVTPRPQARRSSSALSRAMSSLFKRNSIHGDDNGANTATPTSKDSTYSAGTSESSLTVVGKVPSHASRRRFSYHRSSTTTRSNSPPSPGSPLEAALACKDKTGTSSMPTSSDFLDNNSKKHRAHTGLSLRQRVNFAGTARNHPPRRARSLERKTNPQEEHLTRQPWAIPPEAGTGMKARRLSLSLPDDFTLDVAELLKEYEYHHKFLGRHGKHLGKGATSKVTLMVRKGCPGELYAAKEFRPRSPSESNEDYEKKIKSEYSIAKSLHHPNVVETVRLCTDHGRWNHVMEYCSEGDLFSLVSKKYLREEGREVDRLCIFKQLCQGINYLHTNGIAHRDIKLENLLITKDSKLKITDFGVSEVFSGIHPGLRESGGQCGVAMGEVRFCKPGICGSLPYIAPEVLRKADEYDPRALDVWSSAIVMIYLVFSANLWEKAEAGLTGPGQKNYNDLVAGWAKTDAKKVAKPDTAKDAYPKLAPFEYFIKPLALRRLLTNMLHPDPSKRITMNEVITHRWMKNVECCQLESYDDPVKYIDVSKKDCMKSSNGKIFCHNHLPLVSTGHGLPPMPGKPGY
ncbi:putative HAL protein kinase [Rosellinia necatrix]|uniref:Putative HAL protein kinase n=1 Tax=Rosellinia necatrix TaxID=77044 RepID=A0A1W2TNL3_ROSNE|nr:putative HAL protein kinase [Rosellinia necatrix]